VTAWGAAGGVTLPKRPRKKSNDSTGWKKLKDTIWLVPVSPPSRIAVLKDELAEPVQIPDPADVSRLLANQDLSPMKVPGGIHASVPPWAAVLALTAMTGVDAKLCTVGMNHGMLKTGMVHTIGVKLWNGL